MCEREKENERGLRHLSLCTLLSGVAIKEIEEKNRTYRTYATTKCE